VTVPVKHLKNRNYELQGTGWAMPALVAQTLQSVHQYADALLPRAYTH
jgi:hypothetical protein